MLLDHIGFAVADFPRSRAFYTAALAPLGIAVMKEGRDGPGSAVTGRWPSGSATSARRPVASILPSRRRTVSRCAFHAAALAAGGADNGAPGLRPQYHPDYYGAFVIDPDGHNIEAVCHASEP